MADDDRRPSLEAPKLFGRRRSEPAAPVVPDEPAFEDSGSTSETTVVLDDVLHEEPAEEPEAGPARPRPRRRREGPLLPGRPAAALTGLVVGLSLLGFTWLGSRGCEAVRGTSSCGAAPGMAALVVVLALAVVVGGVLLKRFGVPDPGTTSFLGTGLTGIVCLLFLVESLDHRSMLLVLPALTAVTYLVAWWVTTTYVDPS